MRTADFFNILDLSNPSLARVNYFVSCHDYQNAKKELLAYFVRRSRKHLSLAEDITDKDKNFPLAYISRHGILSGPNEADIYHSSLFVSRTGDFISMDVLPFISEKLSFMIMARQKENSPVYFYSPSSSSPPFITIVTKDGDSLTIYPTKYAYITPRSKEPLYTKEVYEICECSETEEEAFSDKTGRVYLGFDFSKLDLSEISSARFSAKINLSEKIETKELLFFNISDSSWDNHLTWDKVKGNVYSWESSLSGPFWISPENSDCEYLNVTARFWFARPMAYQYLADVEKNAVYGEKLLFLMDAFSKKKEGGFNRVLETGERLSNFTAVLNALIDTPVMTPDYLVSILDIMYRDMKSLMENPDLGWSNWAVVRTSGLSKAIDFLPEFKEHEQWRDRTRQTLTSLFDRMYSPDFSFKEAGLSYSFWCMNLFTSAFDVARKNNDPYNAFMRSRLEKAFDSSLDFIYPNLYDTNIGDSNFVDKSDYLTYVGKSFPTQKLDAVMSGKDYPQVPLSSYYPYSNSVIMRTSFNRENGIYVNMTAMPFDGHAHSDTANVIMYAHGRPLVVDCGRYGYSQSDISTYLKTPAAHNNIEIVSHTPTSHSASKSKITHFTSNSLFDFAISEAVIAEDINAVHKRSLLFMKKEGFVIICDNVRCDEGIYQFNQNWNFLPGSHANIDISGTVTTNFDEGGNITLLCPAADHALIKEGIFSSGYGMAEGNFKGVFTKYAQNISLSTLLYPFKGEAPTLLASDLSPADLSYNYTEFTINNQKALFYNKHTEKGQFSTLSFDGEMVFVYKDYLYLAGGRKLYNNSKVFLESPVDFKNICISISNGIVNIESDSLIPCTQREKAIRIYAPGASHVIFNGNSIPFSSYSDYVYAVAVK